MAINLAEIQQSKRDLKDCAAPLYYTLTPPEPHPKNTGVKKTNKVVTNSPLKSEQSRIEEGEREILGNARQREKERERELAMEVQSPDSRPQNNQHLGSSEGGWFDSSKLITELQVLLPYEKTPFLNNANKDIYVLKNIYGTVSSLLGYKYCYHIK